MDSGHMICTAIVIIAFGAIIYGSPVEMGINHYSTIFLMMAIFAVSSAASN